MKEQIIRATPVVKRVDSAFFQNSRQMRVKFLQIGVIFGVSVVKNTVERTSLVDDVLPPAFQDRDVWLVVPTGFSKTLQNVRMSFDNRMMSRVISLKFVKDLLKMAERSEVKSAKRSFATKKTK